MKHAFSIHPDGLNLLKDIYHAKGHAGSQSPMPVQLLLIDDIYTTGSTLDACGQVILAAAGHVGIPLRIYTLTLARS
ncbi:hypothetical protein [Paenibacillus barcinonensis]|nr:hypothetical protein [Paenibacillus barcinonensis]